MGTSAPENAQVGLRELLEAGVHFGHQTRRWNPRMRRFIHGERDGIHIIDLLQTEVLLEEARQFATELAEKGGVILFVGTKKQAQDSVQEWAERCGMPYVNRRWLGGLLTNFNTIRKRIARLHELRSLSEEGQLDLLPTKERMTMQAELAKLEFNLGGVADMERVPDALLVLDITTEEIALNEANRLGLPIIGLVDMNCDPGPVDHIVPGNDDALRACELVVSTIGSSVEAAASEWKKAEEKRIAEEERRRAEEAERRRAEEEAAKKREAEEEAAKKEADAKAKKEADAKAKKEADAKAEKESQPAADSGAKQANPASPGASAKADEPAGHEKPPAEEAQGDTEGGA